MLSLGKQLFQIDRGGLQSMREKNEAVFYSAIYCVLNRKQKTGNAAYLSSTTGLPNIFSVAGHFHMRKFIAGHKRFCDIQ